MASSPFVAFVLATSLAADPFPPALPGGQSVVTETSADFLKPPKTLREGVAVAREPPAVDFAYCPGQTYAGHPWSAWGDSLFANGKYYASLGDHLAPPGNAFVWEYDPKAKSFRQLLDLRKLLALPDGHYTPGKIHTRLDLGADGWLYMGTHRGSTKATTDATFYQGDWIVRVHPESGKSEVVVRGPVPKHCLPTGITDPKRLIFYAGTAPGDREDSGRFLAYDLANRKVLCDAPDGPSRCIVLAQSTGRVYYCQGKDGEGQLVRWDPARGGNPEPIPGRIGMRAASEETPQGVVYTVSQGRSGSEPTLSAFEVRSERVTELGPASVGTQGYITSLDADPSGRFLYYIPGAHGGADADGSPVVQYDTREKRRKVVAFLHPFFKEKYGLTPVGTYSVALDPAGERLFVTWNVRRGDARAWDCCALTVIHILESERRP